MAVRGSQNQLTAAAERLLDSAYRGQACADPWLSPIYHIYSILKYIEYIDNYIICVMQLFDIYIYYIFSFLDLSQNMSSCLIHVHISLQFFTLGLEPLGVRVRRSAPISHCWCSIKSQWRRTRQKMDWLLFNESWSSYSWYSLYREMLYTKMCIYTYIYNI